MCMYSVVCVYLSFEFACVAVIFSCISIERALESEEIIYAKNVEGVKWLMNGEVPQSGQTNSARGGCQRIKAMAWAF